MRLSPHHCGARRQPKCRRHTAGLEKGSILGNHESDVKETALSVHLNWHNMLNAILPTMPNTLFGAEPAANRRKGGQIAINSKGEQDSHRLSRTSIK